MSFLHQQPGAEKRRSQETRMEQMCRPGQRYPKVQVHSRPWFLYFFFSRYFLNFTASTSLFWTQTNVRVTQNDLWLPEGSGLRWPQPWPESSSMQVRVLSHWKERHPGGGKDRALARPGGLGVEGSSWQKHLITCLL